MRMRDAETSALAKLSVSRSSGSLYIDHRSPRDEGSRLNCPWFLPADRWSAPHPRFGPFGTSVTAIFAARLTALLAHPLARLQTEIQELLGIRSRCALHRSRQPRVLDARMAACGKSERQDRHAVRCVFNLINLLHAAPFFVPLSLYIDHRVRCTATTTGVVILIPPLTLHLPGLSKPLVDVNRTHQRSLAPPTVIEDCLWSKRARAVRSRLHATKYGESSTVFRTRLRAAPRVSEPVTVQFGGLCSHRAGDRSRCNAAAVVYASPASTTGLYRADG